MTTDEKSVYRCVCGIHIIKFKCRHVRLHAAKGKDSAAHDPLDSTAYLYGTVSMLVWCNPIIVSICTS